MIITRKIEIYVNEDDKEKRSEYYSQLQKWLYICRKAANIASSHLFVQDNVKDMLYFAEGVKAKLADQNKDEAGILSCNQSTGNYRLLSSMFKGEIPTEILTCLLQTIQTTYKAEKTEYYAGDRSLRSYKKNIPVPFKKTSFRNLVKEERNYTFIWFGIPLKTTFGRDRSNNESIMDRCASNEYAIKQSSLAYDQKKKKWFLLLCAEIPNSRGEIIKGLTVEADLNLLVPIMAKCGKSSIEIGAQEEFLYGRMRIQQKLHNLQKALRYAKGGKGRKEKLQAIETFKGKEKNYIKTKLHTYSAILVNYAQKCKAETIVLVNQEIKSDMAKDSEPILRNWSYYGLQQLIEYKAKRKNITVKLN